MSNECIEEITPASFATNEVRICLNSLGKDEPLMDISFLQVEDPSTGESANIILPYVGDDANTAGVVPGSGSILSMHPGTAFEPQGDGQSGVITILMDQLFDPFQPAPTSITVSGLVVLNDREESFQVDVDLSTQGGDAESQPCSESEDELFVEELNLSNVKEMVSALLFRDLV
jgi:hypothetical protein